MGRVVCLNEDCPQLPILYTGEEHRIFFINKASGVGEELFWDFISLAMSSKVTFSGFCNEMTRRYQTTNTSSAPFLSAKTFRKMLLVWIVKMGIDFRQAIDPWCGHDPKKLACDGTHLGVSAKQLKLPVSVTDSDVPTVCTPDHKRHDRLFIQNEEAREYILYLAQENPTPNLLYGEVHMPFHSINVMQAVEKWGKDSVTNMVMAFVHKELLPPIMRPVLKLLCCSDKASIVSVFPYRYHVYFIECCEAFLHGSPTAKLLQRVRNVLPEAADLLQSCEKEEGWLLKGVTFVQDMVRITVSIHFQDHKPPPVDVQEGTYNPASGVAYYFTEHGSQLRKLPTYDVGHERKSDEDSCRKMYPKVSFGGFGYLFLYFCPHHGYCYGFHIVKGGEGRKDPFFAVTKYKETPPTDIFYDNACQLSEYSLNREPYFWREVRVWHDIFHSFSHKGCGNVFRSRRVAGLSGINSEICECLHWASKVHCLQNDPEAFHVICTVHGIPVEPTEN